MFVLLFSLLSFQSNQSIAVKQIFEKPPSQDLQHPSSLAVGPQGQVYLLDSVAAKVHIWDKKGKYQHSFGNPGQGPGELDIPNQNRNHSYVVVQEEKVVVMVGPTGRLHYFNLDGSYHKIENLAVGGAIRKLYLAGNNTAFTMRRSSGSGFIELRDASFNITHKIHEYQEKKYTPIKEAGEVVGYEIHAFYPEPVIHADGVSDRIIVGLNQKPEIHVYDTNGKLRYPIFAKIPLREVTEEDRREFAETPWIKANPRNKIVYPEHHPLYNGILATKTGYMIFTHSGVGGSIEGLLVSKKDEILKRYHLNYGENAKIFGSHQRVFILNIDENEDYQLQELDL